MAREINEENAREAICRVLSCIGIGAAEENCEEMFERNTLVAVPAAMHNDLPDRLLGCAVNVCTDEPFEWTVEQTAPEIDEETTFEHLYQDWFVQIIA